MTQIISTGIDQVLAQKDRGPAYRCNVVDAHDWFNCGVCGIGAMRARIGKKFKGCGARIVRITRVTYHEWRCGHPRRTTAGGCPDCGEPSL